MKRWMTWMVAAAVLATCSAADWALLPEVTTAVDWATRTDRGRILRELDRPIRDTIEAVAKDSLSKGDA